MSDFDTIKSQYLRQIRQQLKDVVKSVASLDRSISEAVSVSEDFKEVADIWKNFYDPTLLDKLGEEYGKKKEEGNDDVNDEGDK